MPLLTWARAKKDMNSAPTAMPTLASGAMMLPGEGAEQALPRYAPHLHSPQANGMMAV